jgi:chromosome segregation ATPase
MFFFNELMKINNEQTNALRQAFKQNISRRNFMAVREEDDDDAQQTFEEFTKVNNELLATQRTLNKKNAQLDHLNRELQEKNQQLEEALKKVRELSGLLPVCSHCKKVRDDQGYWSELADYLSDHADVMVSHSICPQCSKKLRAEIEEQ